MSGQSASLRQIRHEQCLWEVFAVMCIRSRTQRGRRPGTAISDAHDSGTRCIPSLWAASAGNVATRSGSRLVNRIETMSSKFSILFAEHFPHAAGGFQNAVAHLAGTACRSSGFPGQASSNSCARIWFVFELHLFLPHDDKGRLPRIDPSAVELTDNDPYGAKHAAMICRFRTHDADGSVAGQFMRFSTL